MLFASLLYTAICKASPESHFDFLHFFSIGMVLIPVSCAKNDLHELDKHDGVTTHLEPNILECEVMWALESITMNKAIGVMESQLSYFKS